MKDRFWNFMDSLYGFIALCLATVIAGIIWMAVTFKIIRKIEKKW